MRVGFTSLPHVLRPKRHDIGGNYLFSLLHPEEHLQKETNGNQIGNFSLEQGLGSNSCSTICEPCNQRISHTNCLSLNFLTYNVWIKQIHNPQSAILKSTALKNKRFSDLT